MGIFKFYSTIIRLFPSIRKITIDDKSINYLFLDFNALIYSVIPKEQGDIENHEKIIIANIIIKVKEIINYTKTKYTYIAVDGVCSRSKQIQQRNRRYMNVYNNKNNTNIWSTNVITPGTVFMDKMNKQLHDTFGDDDSIIISDSSEPGEGEHKIFKYINTIKDKSNIIVHGLDADLIVLSLSTGKHNINIMRENALDNRNKLSFIDIKELKKQLINYVSIPNIIDCEQFFHDLTFLFILLGNDFVHEIKCVNDDNMYIDILLNIYKKERKKQFLIEKKDSNIIVNNQFLLRILSSLYEREKAMFHYKEIDEDYTRNNIYNKENICSNYVEGIMWISYTYLNSECPDWEYTYDYSISPYIKDILSFIKRNDINKIHNYNKVNINRGPCKPLMQLMSVLPIQSVEIIPNQYIVNLIKTSLSQFYPMKVLIRPEDTAKLSYLQRPILPVIDFDYFKEIIDLFT